MKKLLWLSVLILLAAAGSLVLYDREPDLVSDAIDQVRQDVREVFSEIAPEIEKIQRSGPLQRLNGAFTTDSKLTIEGTFQDTNTRRIQVGLEPYSMNENLNKAAQAKVNDMFAKQYFAHDSPEGVNAGDLAKNAGYAYILVGENLALGNFKDDVDLVQAWMDSPGLKANILHERFREIGIAVAKGMYEGREVWIAVQEFGLSADLCKTVDAGLKGQIQINKNRLSSLETQLEREKEAMAASRNNPTEYNAHVQTYNQLVNEYNALARQTKTQVTRYNEAVREFNRCVEEV